MAIKGKNKKAKQGARRRPAAAPRPVIPVGRKRTPWYKTAAARGLGIVLLLTVIGVTWAVIAGARERARDERARQDVIERYTSDVDVLLQKLREPVGELAVVAGDVKDLPADAAEASERIQSSLAQVQGETLGLTPPPGATTTNRLFQEAIALYVEAAKAYVDAAKAPEGFVRATLVRVSDLMVRADAAWQIGVADLDEIRAGADLDPSGLTVPRSPAPPADGSSGSDDGDEAGGGDPGKGRGDGGGG